MPLKTGSPVGVRHMEGLRIRAAELRDIRRLAELERACFKEPYPAELLAFFLLSDHHINLVAELNGVIVGFGVAELEHQEGRLVGHVWTLEVLEPYRRRGIGRRLLSELEEALRARGATECYLEVRVDNTPALALYEKMGYRRAGLLQDYYGPGEHGFLMRKRLI